MAKEKEQLQVTQSGIRKPATCFKVLRSLDRSAELLGARAAIGQPRAQMFAPEDLDSHHCRIANVLLRLRVFFCVNLIPFPVQDLQ